MTVFTFSGLEYLAATDRSPACNSALLYFFTRLENPDFDGNTGVALSTSHVIKRPSSSMIPAAVVEKVNIFVSFINLFSLKILPPPKVRRSHKSLKRTKNPGPALLQILWLPITFPSPSGTISSLITLRG